MNKLRVLLLCPLLFSSLLVCCFSVVFSCSLLILRRIYKCLYVIFIDIISVAVSRFTQKHSMEWSEFNPIWQFLTLNILYNLNFLCIGMKSIVIERKEKYKKNTSQSFNFYHMKNCMKMNGIHKKKTIKETHRERKSLIC